MRNRFYVCYDVSEPKRWRAVWKRMHGFGDPVQLSVFQCDLSRQELIQMEAALAEAIHHEEDRVLIVDAGPAERRGAKSARAMGRQDLPEQRRTVVV